MRQKYSLIITALTLTTLLAAGFAYAGWGDIPKSVGDAASTAAGLPYTPSEATAAIKEVLGMGTDSAVETLGTSGGFMDDPVAAIPLPDMFKNMGSDSSGLLSALNTAAEDSVPSVGGLFKDAIDNLDVSNPTAMLDSGSSDTAITTYFEGQSRASLKTLAKPIVSKSLDAAGAGTYLSALTTAQQAASITGTTFDPVDYVTDQTLDAMFHYIGEQEKNLRSTGGAGASALLQKIF
ncbi:DUF4197 domain-containing protein [Pseudodesulfovibrio sediminis]|uniref:DUF4197 domain-containing protein n=1 Tax=Pseudodesulfovibrio sediminis TaxID=2810563 RepID=A0ABM7P7F7_9BACT|nr:DUF4197 domain-containing protein [Pseudodesulfovibrio sediminis]BCS89416.1 hypothetical protein PSDVSF_26580 [Pseudodesulfovibrio sediminis]